MRIFCFSRWFLAVLFAATLLPNWSAQAQAAPTSHPTFEVRVVGQGRPVILIPGLTCPGAVWDETVARYQRQYQCHVVSLAGFGGVPAPQPVPAHLLQDVRDQLLAYVKAQRLKQPVVVGHSLGGFLALWMAATDPTAVGPLEIVDSLPFLPAAQDSGATAATMQPQAEQQRRRMSQGKMSLAVSRQMATTMVTDTTRLTQVARWGAASDAATVSQAVYDMNTTDLRLDVARIQQPVLVLGTWAGYAAYGATRPGVQAVFNQQYARLPRKTIELSAAGKHFIMYDDTAWFFAQTDAFLKQHAGVAKR